MARELACIEYEDDRGFRILLLDAEEADPPCDVIRIELNGEPLMDMTYSEFADFGTLLSLTINKCFKALCLADDALLSAIM